MARPAGEYTQGLRLLQIFEMLQVRRHVTIPELINEFGINRRTVQRDLGALMEHYAVEEGERNAQNEKTFQLTPGSRQEALKLTISEMVALYMGRNMFAFTEGTELKDAMDTLYDKLKARLNRRNVEVRDTLAKKLYCTTGFPKSYRAKDDVFNSVLTGLIDSKKILIRYQIPNKKPYDDVVHPYTLVVHNHALYLIAYSELAEDKRMFALERVRKAEWKDHGQFDYPNEYDPAEMLHHAFGIATAKDAESVRLLFGPVVAPYVLSRKWHPSMRTQQRRGGALEVTMKVSQTEELLHWICGYGPNVRVLSPKKLRETIRKRHQAALA